MARFDDVEWMLIPGGRVRLGYTPGSFRPTAAQVASYEHSQREFGLPPLEQFLRDTLPAARLATIGPLWMEAQSRPLGREPIVAGSTAGERTNGATVHLGDGTRYHEYPVAPAACIRSAIPPWRLPSPDEWEWACRAGTSTLFRWGDDCPGDEYPGKNAAFDGHRRANGFGLVLAADPYDYEPTADPTIAVGGDGGGLVCGGAGFFLGWLALASAWRFKLDDPEEPTFGLHLRRCITFRD